MFVRRKERTGPLSEGECETCDTIIGPCSTSPLARQLYSLDSLHSFPSVSSCVFLIILPTHTRSLKVVLQKSALHIS